MRFTDAVGLALLLSAAPAPPPQTGQKPPAFRSGVEMLTVEATVVDRDGQPARDLAASDFSVMVAGKPRKVLFARFYGSEGSPGAVVAAAAGAAPLPRFTRNAATEPGRIVVFVVDRDSIKPGNERVMLDAAARVLDSLTPADAVGLLALPTGGVGLTREHDRIREALPTMTGTRPAPLTYRDYNVTWDEALGYERNDRSAIAEVVERECYSIRTSEVAPPSQCPENLRAHAMDFVYTGRARVQSITAALDRLAEELKPLRGPKHIVFISGGMPFGLDLLTHYNLFARKAAEAQIVLYAVHLDQPDSDTADRKAVSSPYGGRDMTQGLTTMTGLTGGEFFTAVAGATGVFDRVARDMNNFYELGVEALPEDASGEPRDIDVKVTRAGLTARSRRQVTLPARPAADPLDIVLQQPTDLDELPTAVAAYTTRGSEDETLRVLLSVEFGAAGTPMPLQWGYVVFQEGNPIGRGRQRIDAGPPGPRALTTSVKLAPGRYRLRVAAVDAEGRRGVLEVPLSVGLREAGGFQMSDLIVGTAESDRLQPRREIPAGTALSALIEVLSPDPARLDATRCAIEILRAGSAEPVQRFLMAARTGTSDTVRLNGAEIPTAALQPGTYTASAILLIDGEPAGRVSRVFEVTSGTH